MTDSPDDREAITALIRRHLRRGHGAQLMAGNIIKLMEMRGWAGPASPVAVDIPEGGLVGAGLP